MKIAHLNLLEYLYVGIENKLIEQANAANKLNLDIDYIILNRKKECRLNNILYKKLIYPKKSITRKIMQRFFKFTIINNTIDLSNYDVIVFRYPLPVAYDWEKFTDKYPSKIITEHHAIAIHETISKISIRNFFSFAQEFINSKKFKKNLIGLIGVTDEITKHESKRNIGINVKTISNGIDVSNVTYTKFIPFKNKNLTMTIVASEYAPWHGLDKLLKSLLEFETNLNITINIIGEYISVEDRLLIKKVNDLKNNVNANVLGIKRGKELDDIFSNSTLAIGSLAIYRQKLTEACALKIREYLARGIPFVYSAEDSDIPHNVDFALQIPNKPIPLDFNQIVEFASNISSQRNISSQMRQLAFKRVDWKIKVNELYQFIQIIKYNENIK